MDVNEEMSPQLSRLANNPQNMTKEEGKASMDPKQLKMLPYFTTEAPDKCPKG